jgi:AcrR family transcriptional regulator
MDRKEKIVAAAIAHFNTNGCIPCSMRTIASACRMSLSNLQHHFKTKDVLLETIIEKMCLVFEGTSDFKNKGISLQLLVDMNALWFDFQKTYLFFFSEISALLQQYPTVQKRFSAVKKKRLNEYNLLFNAYASAQLFKPEPYPGFFYGQAELLWFIANYYLSTQLAEGKKFNRKTFDEGNKVATNLIYSMLSEKGILELINLNQRTK